MNARHFEKDGKTGLWKWPVLLNGDWSFWTNEACAILWGEASGCDADELAFQTVGAVLHSQKWPELAAFRVGSCGVVLLAPRYTPGQALLLAEAINRELRQVQMQMPRRAAVRGGEAAFTWGMVGAENPDWNLPRALQAAVFPVERAVRELRLGSINEADAGWETGLHDDFFVCSGRDGLTELKSWRRTLALCSRYGDESIALLMGDIDDFKTINDQYGHGVADIPLQMIGHVLRRFESNDVAVFRAGGDEFFVWTRGHSLERAKRLAQRINAQIKALHIPVPRLDLSIDNVSLTWSVIAASPRDLEMQRLLQYGDELLREAKIENRGSVSTRQI